MIACSERWLELHALLDGELDAVNAAAIEDHVQTCAVCAAHLDRLRSLRTIIGEAALRFEAPKDLRTRIETSLPAGAPPPRPSRFAWAALGAGLAAAASIALMVATPGVTDNDLSHQLVGSHIRSLLAHHLVDVATTDQHIVRPWFNGRIDFSPPTPDLTASGFPLAGGRLDYIDGRVVSAIVYRRRLHTINLFVWPATKPLAMTSAHFEGYNLRHWTQDGLQFWAVSDVPAADMAAFQRSFVAAH